MSDMGPSSTGIPRQDRALGRRIPAWWNARQVREPTAHPAARPTFPFGTACGAVLAQSRKQLPRRVGRKEGECQPEMSLVPAVLHRPGMMACEVTPEIAQIRVIS